MSFDTCLGPVLLGSALLAAPLAAQEAPAAPAGPILSSEIAVSRDVAELRLELPDGDRLSMLLDEDGAVRLNGERIGAYERRDALDSAFRDLLQRAMDTPTPALADLLVQWEPPEGSAMGRRLDRELEAAIGTASIAQTPAAPGDAADSIQRLNERIREMERLIENPEALEGLERLEKLERLEELESLEQLEELRMLGPAMRDLRREIEREVRSDLRQEFESRDWTDHWRSPWRHFTRGLGGIFSTLVIYAILVGLGFLAVFFGRKYLERIADTARQQTLRCGLVGLAGSFLVLPAYILGLLALAISIIGIVLIPVFAPLFPVAVVLAAIGGYLAVAHGAGEALAERRFTGNDWFTRANSYYYVLTGVGLLLVLFLAAHIVSMAGPWLGFIEGLLKFMAVMLTWAAFTVGFGAVLISRAGTRPVNGEESMLGDEGLDEEPSHV
ncbi:MAG: hypothetical protein ACOCVZ_06265 [Gemmatimonadota bacterium]